MATNTRSLIVLTGKAKQVKPTIWRGCLSESCRAAMLRGAFKNQQQDDTQTEQYDAQAEQYNTQAEQYNTQAEQYNMQAKQAEHVQVIQESQTQAVQDHKPLPPENDEEWKAMSATGPDDNTSSSAVKRSESQHPAPVEVSSANALSVFMQGGHTTQRHFLTRADFWHKFIIEGGAKYDSDLLMRVVMDTVFPLDIIPVLYRVEGEDATFLARNCGSAVGRLCTLNMSIMLPQGVALSMRVILGFKDIKDMPLNMQANLLKVIYKRYNKARLSLDLSNYCKDPDLQGLIFCPLSQPRILAYVLRSAKRVPCIKEIDLSHNELSNIMNMEAHWHVSLKRVNLSYNRITSVKEIEVLASMHLTHLNLDHNPLCAQYEDEATYISAVRSVIPTIEVLDGVVLGPPGFPQMKRNHMWTKEDARMADEFLRHYFTLYDSDNRRYLLGLYHEDASFSLTAHHIPGQNTSSTARLTDYTIESRNLMKISDYTKNMQLLHHGSEDILATLCRLPRSEHDPYSFCVDLTHLPAGMVISVKGVFREPTVSKEPLVRSFNRIFILIAISPTEYQIANEMLHICNATTKQVENSFKIPKAKIETLPAKVPLILNESEKEQMAEIFATLTEMNLSCSKQCLEEASWNIRDALTAFVQLYKANKVPMDAFVR